MNFKIARKAAGFTQEEVAEAIEMSRSAYTNIENGRRKADYDVLTKLSALFGVSIDFLLGRDTLGSAPQSGTEPSENTITIIGRNGKVEKIECTEEQIEKIKKMIDIIIPDDRDF